MPKLFGRNFTRRQLLNRVGDISQLMYARRAERREGFERGARPHRRVQRFGLGVFRPARARPRHCLGPLQGPVAVLPLWPRRTSGRPSTSQRDSNGGAAGSAG